MEKSIPLGSIIVLPGGGEAVLKYTGPVQNKGGLFAGVELIGEMSSKGKNSGEFEGVQYFKTTSPNTGLFLPYSRVLSLNQHRAISQPRSPLVTSNRSTPISARGSATRISTNLSGSEISDDIENTKPSNDVILLQRKMNQLKQDYQDVVKRNQSYEAQLKEKTELLNQLETTRKEHFEPALLNYEKQLSNKDAKFLKYKEGRDNELKELVEAVEVLDQQAKENEVLYLNKIGELESQIESYEQQQQETSRVVDDQRAGQLQKLEEKLLEKEFLIEQLRSSNEKEVMSLREILEKTERQRDSLIESTKDQSETGNRENDLIAQVSVLENSNAGLLSQIESFRTENKDLQLQITAVQTERDQTMFQMKELQQQFDNTLAKNSTLKSQIANYESSSNEFDNLKNQLESQINSLQQENIKYSQRLSELESINANYESKINSISSEKDTIINDLKNQKMMLEREIESLKYTVSTTRPSQTHNQETTPLQNDPQQYLRVDNIIDVFNELPIYSPGKVVDASAGRSKWCGLCEREGHESIECPYENDMF